MQAASPAAIPAAFPMNSSTGMVSPALSRWAMVTPPRQML